jgi:tetratricopeptide (TPR) repeat protein
MDYNRLGLAKSESGDYQGAIDDYTQALNLNPDWCLYYNRASARCRLGDYEGAVDDYTQVLNLNPGDEVSYIRRGYARMQLGDYEGAINDNAQAQLRRY